jgi:hypothetical protein
MPQKKNPDSLELLRGKSGRIFGDVRLFYAMISITTLNYYATDGRLPDDLEGTSLNLQQGSARR